MKKTSSMRLQVSDELQRLAEEALNIVKDREAERGDFGESLITLSDYWNTFLTARGFITGKLLTPTDVGVMLTLMKIARMSKGFELTDNFMDGFNYLLQACASRKHASTVGYHIQRGCEIERRRVSAIKSEKLLHAITSHFGCDVNNTLDVQKLLVHLTKLMIKKENADASEPNVVENRGESTIERALAGAGLDN